MSPEVQAMLDRCDREIEEMRKQHDSPAWLVALGINDWEMEKQMILNENGLYPARPSDPTVETVAAGAVSSARIHR